MAERELMARRQSAEGAAPVRHGTLQPGRALFGRFEVIAERRGANSTIYEAFDTRENRKVAVKEVNLEHCRMGGGFRKLDMVKREFRAGRNVAHANLTAYHEAFEGENGAFFLVRDWAGGNSLQEFVAEGKRFNDWQIHAIVGKVLDAAAYLHSLNPPIVHRDIKPANIVVKMDGEAICEVKLIDLGAIPEQRESGTSITTHIYSAGFTAPEALSSPCPASDLFSIASVILYLKSGKDADAVYDASQASYTVPSEAGVFTNIISRGLELALSKRYQNAQEMKDALAAAEKNGAALVQFQKVGGLYARDEIRRVRETSMLIPYAHEHPDKDIRREALAELMRRRLQSFDSSYSEGCPTRYIREDTYYSLETGRYCDVTSLKMPEDIRIAFGMQLAGILARRGEWRRLQRLAKYSRLPSWLAFAMTKLDRKLGAPSHADWAPVEVKRFAASCLGQALEVRLTELLSKGDYKGAIHELKKGGVSGCVEYSNDPLPKKLKAKFELKIVDWLAERMDVEGLMFVSANASSKEAKREAGEKLRELGATP